MPPFILSVDRGVEPYRPPVLEPNPYLPPPSAPASANALTDEERGAGTPELARHARQAYEESTRRPLEPQPAILAGQIMTTPVVTLPPEASTDQAWAIIRERRFAHLPIVGPDGRILGILTDRDLLRGTPPARAVKTVMSTELVVASPDTPIREVARILVERRFGCVPIVGTAQMLVGIVSRTDILRCVIQQAPLDLWI
jgi:acetoin utilization protein AcuB